MIPFPPFDVSVTVSIDATEAIDDWGYVYRAPDGRIKEISLKGFGSTYTDTRYAYFRNENPSTCTLYGYVKYVGNDTPVYGEPHDYLLEHKNVTDDEEPIDDFNMEGSWNLKIIKTKKDNPTIKIEESWDVYFYYSFDSSSSTGYAYRREDGVRYDIQYERGYDSKTGKCDNNLYFFMINPNELYGEWYNLSGTYNPTNIIGSGSTTDGYSVTYVMSR